MTEKLNITSPVDGSIYWQADHATDEAANESLASAKAAQKAWSNTPLEERVAHLKRFVAKFSAYREEMARDVAMLIGRPLSKADEMDDFIAICEDFFESAPEALGDIVFAAGENEQRRIERQAKGVCLSICAWNFPVVMSAGQIVAPLLAGNTVIFKQAPQTAKLSTYVRKAAEEADLPEGILHAIDLTHSQAERMLSSGDIQVLYFIGSVNGGLAVRKAASTALVYENLELGGKDPAYVRADANLNEIIAPLAAGSFNNSGQSCCSVERIYVHRDIYQEFVDAFVAKVDSFVQGDPMTENCDLGSVVSHQAAQRINGLIADALKDGAQIANSPNIEKARELGDAYVAPHVLVNVDDASAIMNDETFGPVVSISPVDSDEEAIERMNKSAFGLTASVWTQDMDQACLIGKQVETGLFYVNRCDAVDPVLPWGGVKNSGLSRAEGHFWAEPFIEYKSIFAAPNAIAPAL